MTLNVRNFVSNTEKDLLWWQVGNSLRGFFFKLAARYNLSDQDSEDIFYEVIYGAIEGSKENESFKPNSTYLIMRMKGAIKDHMRDIDTFSRSRREKTETIEMAMKHTSQSLEQVLASMNLTIEEWHDLKIPKRCHFTVLPGIDRDITLGVNPEGNEGTSLMDKHFADRIRPDVLLERTQVVNLISEKIGTFFDALLSLMDTRLAIAFYLYYGENFGFNEIGEFFGVTESRFSQLFSKGVNQEIFIDAYDLLEDGISFDFAGRHMELSPTQLFEMKNLFFQTDDSSLPVNIDGVDIDFADILTRISARMRETISRRIAEESGSEVLRDFERLLRQESCPVKRKSTPPLKDKKSPEKKSGSLLDILDSVSGDVRTQISLDLKI